MKKLKFVALLTLALIFTFSVACFGGEEKLTDAQVKTALDNTINYLLDESKPLTATISMKEGEAELTTKSIFDGNKTQLEAIGYTVIFVVDGENLTTYAKEDEQDEWHATQSKYTNPLAEYPEEWLDGYTGENDQRFGIYSSIKSMADTLKEIHSFSTYKDGKYVLDAEALRKAAEEQGETEEIPDGASFTYSFKNNRLEGIKIVDEGFSTEMTLQYSAKITLPDVEAEEESQEVLALRKAIEKSMEYIGDESKPLTVDLTNRPIQDTTRYIFVDDLQYALYDGTEVISQIEGNKVQTYTNQGDGSWGHLELDYIEDTGLGALIGYYGNNVERMAIFAQLIVHQDLLEIAADFVTKNDITYVVEGDDLAKLNEKLSSGAFPYLEEGQSVLALSYTIVNGHLIHFSYEFDDNGEEVLVSVELSFEGEVAIPDNVVEIPVE